MQYLVRVQIQQSIHYLTKNLPSYIQKSHDKINKQTKDHIPYTRSKYHGLVSVTTSSVNISCTIDLLLYVSQQRAKDETTMKILSHHAEENLK